MKSILLLLLLGVSAMAHPLAQGSMDLTVEPAELVAQVRVSNEEVFVQAAYAPDEPADIHAAFKAHGNYVLSKLRIFADGVRLTGTMEKVEEPADQSVRGFAKYELHYPLKGVPKELRLEQQLMNEIAYAPGNPWEATLSVRVTVQGRLVRESDLLTHREPLVIALESKAAPSSGVFREYLWHGIHHILEGWDHLLFMSALVLAVRRLKELLAVVTAFTVAHTITLTLSVFDIVRLSPRIVEPMIAASIVVVALQNVLRPRQVHGWLRLGLAFGFGLFHGLGFAGGLLEAMQSGASVGWALTGFSIGVELGHQVVVLPIFLGLALVRARLAEPERRERLARRIMRIGSAVIAAAGCFYLVVALRME